MSQHRPLEKGTRRTRPLTDDEKAKQRKQKEKQDFYFRNPHLKWNDR